MKLALAGGVGGARLALGLAATLAPPDLTIVVNVGDDFEHLGLTICPDLDTVMYTLAGLNNAELGWGRRDETWSFMETLERLGGETWFRLGDRDLAVHVARTQALKSGERLSKITRRLASRLGVEHAILPMSDDPVRTLVSTDQGELDFQDYFVRLKCRPRVRGFRWGGIESARAPAPLLDALDGGRIEAMIVCPSNPYISIDPIVSLPDIRARLARRSFPVVAVSPIVGGQAVKGPAAKMMAELGRSADAVEVARHYGALVDAWIIDRRDATLAREIEAMGKTVMAMDTMMADRSRSIALAQAALELAARCRGSRS